VTLSRQPANSPYFYDKAVKFMRSDPKGYLGCVFFKIRTLLSGIEASDATLFEHGGRWWMFAT